MLAYVFVYNSSNFKVDGEHPLRQFQPEGRYEQAADVIVGGSERDLDPGIYAIWSEDSNATQQLQTESQAMVDHDLFLVSNKDGWPSLIDERTSVDPAKRARVLAKFPTLTDSQLKSFFDERSAQVA